MKKHLQALDKLRVALKQNELLDTASTQALELLEAKAGMLPAEKKAADGPLPAPAEIKDYPQGLALYTDGACRGNPGPGAWACVAQKTDGTVVFESCGHELLTTNNKMEILAVIGAYRQFEQYLLDNPFQHPNPVMLFTDSKYVVDGLNQWTAGWKSKGWKKADGKTPENLELWQEIDALKEKFSHIKVGWVKGHNGHPQNEHCDALANRLLDDEGQ
jgi:ribonuclease HI